MDTFTTPELLACIAREVALRESCYPKWAKTTLEALPAGKRKEIDMMRAVSEHLTALAQDNARLVDETHRWSEAVKKLEAERVAASERKQGSQSKSPITGISGGAYSWLDAKGNPPTEFDPEDEFFTRKFIVCIDGKVSTNPGYFTKSGRWIITGHHGDPVNVTHYRDYPANPPI